ncbi:MAG: RNA polymerase factor sigma-54 [Candidatus Hydrogenedentes bacterium]|nr:RNA polymerase factor sigma-54 [Candidatus Hydrogenedentota bacterium]
MMHMEHRLAQTQTQRLMLTQKMQQAIHILQLSGIELEQYVQQELETNPVLDQIQKEAKPEPERIPEVTEHADGKAIDDSAFNLDDYASMWTDFRREGTDFSRNNEVDSRREYYQNSITKEESFSSKLLTQLRLAAPDEKTYEIGESIIGDIDNKGYFTGSVEEIAEKTGVTPTEVERVLYMVQRFEPTGVGARDIVECLLLQTNVEYPDEHELKTLISEHLEELEHRQVPKIAKAMGITQERVEELTGLLARLDPWPGLEFSSDPPQYVTPDVIVEKIDDEYVVYLSDETIPELRINGDYRQMMQNGRVTKVEKQYLRDKVESARWLIRNIQQRQQTILRIASAIVDVQRDFFEHGIERIKPLTLQEIADRVGVHEATVSRTTRGKYMQTPQGLFEMKYFFSPGLKRDTGDAQSSKSVQSVIKKIIDEEDKSRPLSDQKIADILKRQGLNIARRTVTKYREALGILSTTMRRTYQDS